MHQSEFGDQEGLSFVFGSIFSLQLRYGFAQSTTTLLFTVCEQGYAHGAWLGDRRHFSSSAGNNLLLLVEFSGLAVTLHMLYQDLPTGSCP